MTKRTVIDAAQAAYIAHMSNGDGAMSEQAARRRWETYAPTKGEEDVHGVHTHWRIVADAVLKAGREI